MEKWMIENVRIGMNENKSKWKLNYMHMWISQYYKIKKIWINLNETSENVSKHLRLV